MGQISGITQEDIKRRMRDFLRGDPEWTLRRVADESGEDYKSVQRWVTGGTTVPAHFLAAFSVVTGASERWLLTGEDSGQHKEPAPSTEGSETGVSLEPMGDRERLDVLRLLAQVQDAVAGRTTPAASTPPGRSDRDALQRVDEIQREAEGRQREQDRRDQTAQAG
jgi:hypothetical protein